VVGTFTPTGMAESLKNDFVLTPRQTRRPLRSVLHFGHGRKWHEIEQPNDGQANASPLTY